MGNRQQATANSQSVNKTYAKEPITFLKNL